MRTTAQKIQLAARIRALSDDDVAEARIAVRLGVSIDIVRRVLRGKGVSVDHIIPIDDLPTVTEEQAHQMRMTGWPANEDATTQAIYDAAEAIREKRPRNPVGYQRVEINLRGSIDVQGLPRGGRSKL